MTEVTLTAVYEEAEEGGYIGYVAELPGANTKVTHWKKRERTYQKRFN